MRRTRLIVYENVRAPGVSSGAIAYFGAGGYSHSQVLDETGWTWSARSDLIPDYTQPGRVMIPAGFQRRPPNYAKWIKRTHYALRVTELQCKRFWEIVHDELKGKPYDKFAIACFALPFLAHQRDWRDPTDWFCSEAMAYATEKSGAIRELDEHVHWITPGGWGLVLNGAGAKIRQMPIVWPPPKDRPITSAA